MTAFTETDTDTGTETGTRTGAPADDHARVPGWEGILDPGERILWQGRPDQRFHVDGGDLFGAGFGLIFAGFAVFWMLMAARMDAPFWMFGLIHFSVGVGLVFKTILGPTLQRRQTWYTLTDRRAFIATDSARKGRRLQSYPIDPDIRISFFEGPPDTLHFARETRTTDKGRTYTVPLGFDRIADGHKVFALLRQVQRDEKTRDRDT